MRNTICSDKDYRVSGKELTDMDDKIRSLLGEIKYLARAMSEDLTMVQSDFESVVKMTARFGHSTVRINEIANDFSRALNFVACDLAHTPIEEKGETE